MPDPGSTSDRLQLDGHHTASDDHTPRPRPLLRLLRGRMHWAIILALLLGIAGAVGGYQWIDPIYRSTGSIRVAPSVRPVMEHTGSTRDIPHYDAYLDAQAALLRSRQVVERAVQHEAWQRLGRGGSDPWVQYFRNQLNVGRSRGSQVMSISFYDGEPIAAAAAVEAAIQAYHNFYQQQEARADEQILHQLYLRRDRLNSDLARLRNRRTEIAGQYGVEGLSRRYQLQLEQLSEVQEMLRRTRVQLQSLREAGDDPQDREPPSIDEIAMVDERMRNMLEEREQLQLIIDRHQRLGLGERHREVARTTAERDALNQRIEAYAMQFTSGDIALPQMPTTLDPTMPMLDTMLSEDELVTRERDLDRLREQMREEALVLGEQQQAIDDIYETLDQRRAELAETERYIDRITLQAPLAERIEVIGWGEIPGIPYNQGQRLQLAALAGGGGAMFGVGLVMLLGRLDRRVQHVDDAQGSLPTARLLGILPTLPADLAAPEQVAIAAHCVHHIRTLLQVGHKSRHSPVLMRDQRGQLQTIQMDYNQDAGKVYAVSSPEAGAGKTSLTIALGLSFATSEARTLIIDCDVVGAGLSRRLNANVYRSLADVLLREKLVDNTAIEGTRPLAQMLGRPLGDMLVELGHLSPENLDYARSLRREMKLGLPDVCEGEPLTNCTADTGVRRLSVLPVGSARPHQAGFLSPAALKRVFDQARKRFDVVLVDTGPIPGSIEAAMTAAEADQVVLVVSRGVERNTLVQSLEHIQSIGTPLAGVVFNHALQRDVFRSYSRSRSSQSAAVESQLPFNPHPSSHAAASRFGPVGSAVASYAPGPRAEERNQPRNGL
ncbi:hypothetical protein ACERK3_12560 [Phycisphaerales bacterium AB-hyl4]|uniref:Capsular exopolysaccharide synthesis family protein n=1 Tax=Natronomicrosphaera hydrolytica TaxID=3242702 RepID=A0ABV4U693_9BACT